MKLAFLLHLYQPPTQTEVSFKAIAQQCYVPLVKLLKSRTNDDVKFTLNLPLSILEQFEKYGYKDLLNNLKELVESSKIEITGSGAYHPLLTKTLHDFGLKQIILNEYGLGYYFGQRQGFEGEVSVMTKDVRGFFAPEMAMNDRVLKELDELHYEWVAVDEPCVGVHELKSDSNNVATIDLKNSPLFNVAGHDIKLVVRNSAISNLIAFKRDGDTSDILKAFKNEKERGTECILIALDGETFGHHNKEGIYLLSNLIDELVMFQFNLSTVTQLVNNCSHSTVANINECTWSTTDNSNKYPFWYDKKNTLQIKLWELSDLVCDTFYKLTPIKIVEGLENIAIWNPTDQGKIIDESSRAYIQLENYVFKSMHSDQFWSASTKSVGGKMLFSPDLINNALTIYKKISEFPEMAAVKGKIDTLIDNIKTQLSDKLA